MSGEQEKAVLGSVSLTYIDPTFSYHLKQNNVSIVKNKLRGELQKPQMTFIFPVSEKSTFSLKINFYFVNDNEIQQPW